MMSEVFLPALLPLVPLALALLAPGLVRARPRASTALAAAVLAAGAVAACGKIGGPARPVFPVPLASPPPAVIA